MTDSEVETWKHWVAIKMEKGVFLIFPVKDIQLAALLQNFQGSNNIHQVSVPSILSGEAKLSMASCDCTTDLWSLVSSCDGLNSF